MDVIPVDCTMWRIQRSLTITFSHSEVFGAVGGVVVTVVVGGTLKAAST